MARFTHRSACILCDSGQVEIAVPIKASPIADAYISADMKAEPQPLFPLDLYLCRACGHVQLMDVVKPDEIYVQVSTVKR